MSVDYTVYLAEDSVAIFLLHGVVRSLPWKVRNYNRKHIELDYFVSVMRQLKENGHPIDMETIVECQLAGIPLPPRSFAITFDDGFENNYSVAAPALAELNIPATFYLTTSFVGTSRCSWIDRIEAVVERHCNASLHVPWRNSPVSYESPTEAIKLLEEIRSRVKQDSSLNPEQVADELAGQLMGNGMAPFDTALDGKLSWEQVLAMQADPLFCIGGHSHTHAILGFLDRDGQKTEINTSLKQIKLHAGTSVRHYSYPEGQSHCFNCDTIELLQEAGVVCCPTAISGVNRIPADLFGLRRIAVL